MRHLPNRGGTPTGAQNIAITVGGATSNALNFTVNSAGTIYYAADGPQMQSAMDNMVAGDVTYVLDGVNVPGGVVVGYGAVSSAGAPLAIVTYPGATATVGSSPSAVGFSLDRSGTGYWITYSKFNIWGISQGSAVVLSSNSRLVGSKIQEIGWNYFHDNAGIRAINIYNGMPNNNPISGHRVHDNLIVNQSSTGIFLAKGVVGENWVYNNIVINAGLGPTDGENVGIWLHAGWSGLGWGSMPDSYWPTSSTTLHVYNNTVLNAGYSGGGSANGAWMMDTVADWIPDVHNNLTVQTNGNPYIASASWQYINTVSWGITPNAAYWSNGLWYGGGPAPAFDVSGIILTRHNTS